MKVSQEHLTYLGNEKWQLRIKPTPKVKQFKRRVPIQAPPNSMGKAPKIIVEEAQEIVSKAILGMKKDLEAAKLRKERVPTIGEIIDHYRGHSRIQNNLKEISIRENINNLTKLVAACYGIETPLNANSKCRAHLKRSSVKVAGSAKAAKYREEEVGKMPLTVLNGDLIDQYIDLRKAEGPHYYAFEVIPEHLKSKNGKLSDLELKRVKNSIRGEIRHARAIFAHASASVGNLICPIEGIYQKFRMPDSVMEFKKRYTFKKPGKVDYIVPTIKELSKLWNGMPEFKRTFPEAYKGFKIAADTGLRLDEFRFLMWDQFQERANGIFITVKDNGMNAGTKSGNERPVRISKALYEELIDMETSAIYVIGGSHEFRQWQLGKAISDYMRSKEWKRRLCAHELRKWFGAMVADRTKSLVDVMHILGHKSYDTTRGTYEGIVEYPVYDDITATLPGSASDPKPSEKVA